MLRVLSSKSTVYNIEKKNVIFEIIMSRLSTLFIQNYIIFFLISGLDNTGNPSPTDAPFFADSKRLPLVFLHFYNPFRHVSSEDTVYCVGHTVQ